FRDRGRRAGGRPPRRAGNRPVALHGPGTGHRLAPRGPMGRHGLAPAHALALGAGHVLERQSPPSEARRFRPGPRLLPARPLSLPAALSRRGGPGRLYGRLSVAGPPAAQRCLPLFPPAPPPPPSSP